MREMTSLSSLRYVILLAVTVSALGLSACENPSREETTPSSPAGASMRSFGTPTNVSRAADDFDIEEVSDDVSAIEHTIASASTWKEAHRDVRNLMESPSDVPQYIREQAAAHEMFRQHLSTDHWRADVTKEKAEVLGFYTNLLVKNRSPASDLVYLGLQQLDEHWSDQRIVAAIDTTIHAVEREYGPIIESMERDQEAPSSDSVKPGPGSMATRDQHVARLLEANRRLQNIADSIRGTGSLSVFDAAPRRSPV